MAQFDGMLSPYKVLDLTDEKGLLCGKLLGDMGADVIKIERPGGDAARNLGPFFHDEIDPEKSLFWLAYNANKRGITLDIEKAEGQEIFKKLVATADFVIESFAPGYLDKLGLGYAGLQKINPQIILVSITPFGQTGPYKDYKAPDIVAWAMGGQMYCYGDTDRAPVRISHHSQAYLHAGAEAAAGAMMALYHRHAAGEGQQVDVSVQECVAQIVYTYCWNLWKVIRRRGDDAQPNLYAPNNPAAMRPNTDVHLRVTHIWPCKDGYIVWLYWGGVQALRWSAPMVNWMLSEGVDDAFLKNFDWRNYSQATTTQEIVDRLEKITREFFLTRTRRELYEAATKHRFMLYPVFNIEDILNDAQLKERNFWSELTHEDLGAALTYPGAFANTSEEPPRLRFAAPHIGQHNTQVYEKELGFSNKEISALQKAGVI
ncbi:MAG: CoA transferase [Dehalococcoidales bacterium]|nr:CoA transferase [Dehalococcoidales bacterium]